jgi:hypothetical protein
MQDNPKTAPTALLPVRRPVTSSESKAAAAALIAKGLFPQPVKVGTSTRFSEREGQFVAERIAERDQARASSREWRGRIMGVRLRCCDRLSL